MTFPENGRGISKKKRVETRSRKVISLTVVSCVNVRTSLKDFK